MGCTTIDRREHAWTDPANNEIAKSSQVAVVDIILRQRRYAIRRELQHTPLRNNQSVTRRTREVVYLKWRTRLDRPPKEVEICIGFSSEFTVHYILFSPLYERTLHETRSGHGAGKRQPVPRRGAKIINK